MNSILLSCEALHMSTTGASDPLPKEDEQRIIRFLQSKLEEWEERRWTRSNVYDEAVRMLIVATLAEAPPYEPPLAVNPPKVSRLNDYRPNLDGEANPFFKKED